jgi:iron complex outermembrane receptor protein
LDAKIGSSFGNFDYQSYYSVINGSNDRWQYFADISVSTSDGYQNDTRYDPSNFYTRLAYLLNDTTDIEFHGSHMNSRGVWPDTLTQVEFDENPRQNPGLANPFENDYNLGALVLKKRFGDDELQIKLIGKDEYVEMDWAGLGFEFDEREIYPAITYAWRTEPWAMKNQLFLGVEYRDHELTTKLSSAFGPLRDTLREDTSFAAFAVNELSVTEALTITGGARFDSFDQDQTGRINPANTVEGSDEAISPKLGATYTFNDGLNVFAGFNSAYKSPARVPGAAYSSGLDPEKVYSYEAGFRGTPLPWLSYSVAGFLNQYKDKWLQTGIAPTDPYKNAGETEAQGVELFLRATFETGFFTDINYTYQESKYEDFVESGVKLDDNWLPNIPEQLLGFLIGYENPVFGQVTFTVDYVGDRYFNQQNTLKGDGYWILGASYKKTFENQNPGVSVFLDVKNLTDEEEVLWGSGSPGTESLRPIYGQAFTGGIEFLF